MNAYADILPADTYPMYVLFIDIDPARIDINVHPTKTEIKYEDEKAIYAILRSAVKRSIGRYNIAPALDFDQETGFSHLISDKPLDEIRAPAIAFNPDFNPFEEGKTPSVRTSDYARGFDRRSGIPQNWAELYQITQREDADPLPLIPHPDRESDPSTVPPADRTNRFFQLHNRFIVSQIHSGLMLIDQQAAHERILFEQYRDQLENRQGSSQQSLFPQTVELGPADFALMEDILPDIQTLGFQLRPFGKTAYVVDGIPSDLGNNVDETKILEQILEDFKNNKDELRLDKRENLAHSLARNAAIRPGTVLDNQEMANLVDRLFATESPAVSLCGKPIVVTISLQELMEKFS